MAKRATPPPRPKAKRKIGTDACDRHIAPTLQRAGEAWRASFKFRKRHVHKQPLSPVDVQKLQRVGR